MRIKVRPRELVVHLRSAFLNERFILLQIALQRVQGTLSVHGVHAIVSGVFGRSAKCSVVLVLV